MSQQLFTFLWGQFSEDGTQGLNRIRSWSFPQAKLHSLTGHPVPWPPRGSHTDAHSRQVAFPDLPSHRVTADVQHPGDLRDGEQFERLGLSHICRIREIRKLSKRSTSPADQQFRMTQSLANPSPDTRAPRSVTISASPLAVSQPRRRACCWARFV